MKQLRRDAQAFPESRRAAYPSAGTNGARRARQAPDYRTWSVEELRALAHQLQLPGAAAKTRSELLRLFDASAA
jgi:hypothetical protein